VESVRFIGAFVAAYSVAQVNYVAGLHSKAQQLVALTNSTTPRSRTTFRQRWPRPPRRPAWDSGPRIWVRTVPAQFDAVQELSPVPYWCAAFDAHAGRVPLQFQTISYTLDPDDPNLPQLPALVPYGITNHAQIFELYPQDWLTADDPTYASYPAPPRGLGESARVGGRAAWRFALRRSRQFVTQRKPTCDMPESIICGERAAGRKRRQ